ncbi:hypothetical protein PU630_15280 [Microbacterium horticulturae]|uniref:Uncharacterized protein n=1 Tax=Microbacterium horticulturae TaxID=3028316 RepID=A0ABY8BWM6_9MICO|nr:DUF6716 putative glycosyltransferase [Microbacterium sp. KACC 23027]WEG08588.1 hypothetical protein PU630_15280 [Microbacterium sp. KACC 23027]
MTLLAARPSSGAAPRREPASRPAPRSAATIRVVAIADADSYVKWAAATLDAVDGIDPRMLIVRTPLTVSRAQERTALAGTALGAGEPAARAVSRVSHEGIATRLRTLQPDVVLIAGRGPFVRLVQREIDRLESRPVIVTGMPGISIPAQIGAVKYRQHSDLLVVHSLRERRAFAQLCRRVGTDLPLGLATLPFARREPVAGRAGGTDLVFAAQAIVPREHEERRQLAEILVAAAQAHPDRRVVLKLRSREGENETHYERTPLVDLLRERPDNLVVSYAPMSTALQTAEGLVTVGSTAAIEALAMGVPVIALDVFGVRKTLLNTVFRTSGLLGDADDVIARRFRHPDPTWAADNYFHDAAESTWWTQVIELVEQRRRGTLAPRRVPSPRGGALHAAFERKSVLGHEDRTVSGAFALAMGAPLAAGIVRLRRFRHRAAAHSWTDESGDVTVTPALHVDPIRRPACR